MQPNKNNRKIPRTPPNPEETKSVLNVLTRKIFGPIKNAINPYVD